jgi:outer membrane protein assembly factor BamB
MMNYYQPIPENKEESKWNFVYLWKKVLSNPWITLTVFIVVTFTAFSLFGYAIGSPQCLGPPYIYATTHHEIPNVIKYSRDGCLLASDVLVGGPIESTDHLSELRTITVGKYEGQEALYVADATSMDSFLLMYGTCDSKGHRHYKETIISTDLNPGVDHTYGITFDKDGNVYASFQHTDAVIRFKRDTFETMDLTPGLLIDSRERRYFPGTFYQFGNVGVHSLNEQGIRSILVVGNDLWIANEDINGIVIVPLNTGLATNIVVIKSPIGLYYDIQSNLVFVGSKEKHWGGAVYAVDPNYLKVVRTYTTNRMNHPSGIVVYDNVLYVAEQILGAIFAFNVQTGSFIRRIVKNTPGQIEQLALSSC